jgi:hypothetical protein
MSETLSHQPHDEILKQQRIESSDKLAEAMAFAESAIKHPESGEGTEIEHTGMVATTPVSVATHNEYAVRDRSNKGSYDNIDSAGKGSPGEMTVSVQAAPTGNSEESVVRYSYDENGKEVRVQRQVKGEETIRETYLTGRNAEKAKVVMANRVARKLGNSATRRLNAATEKFNSDKTA